MAEESRAQLIIYRIINPFINLLHKMGVTPNMLTSFGLILNIVAAIIFIIGAEQADRTDMFYVGWGGFTILIAGLFDMMDGRLARVANLSSTFGAFYDSVIDRYSELVMFLGICYYLISQDYFLSSLFAFIALIGSMMVSYNRS
ncbi:MAG: CDP-alcohol phosphatidyltransferase family protein [Flavobacteriales bacterium]|nr:CDP-alcohol phosphatidyltransferase family protein [Flavobacteriales bacterium]